MRRRELLILLGGTGLGFPGPASAQHKAMPLIGWLGFVDNEAARDGFRRGLRDLGYVEGKNIGIQYRAPKGGDVSFAAPIEELVRLGVNLIVTAGFPPTAAAHRAALAIPVVFVVADPIGSGFVDSLARPGGNMTGMSLAVEERFGGKWLELLKEAAPRVSRAAYIWNPANHSSVSSWAAMQNLAPKFSIALTSVTLHNPKDIDEALAAVLRERAEGLIIDSDAVTGLVQAEIAAFGRANRLPLVSVFRRVVDAGGLLSYGPNLYELWRHAALYVDKLLKGAKPADLPVEEPTAFELVVNLETAKAIGLTLPYSIVVRADEVIE
jgi:putative ABC transport system substrate-binding protein